MSSLLAFFPVVTTVAALLVQANADAVARTIARLLYDVIPPGTEDVVRAVALPTGLVDVKVAAVDDVWSGLKLVRRLKNR